MLFSSIIDGIDLYILNILQRNARTPNVEIARKLGLAPSATLERIRKLEQRGIIRGYEARLNPAALDLSLVAFVFVRSNETAGAAKTARRLAAIPGVQEVHHVAGEDCFLVKVRAANTQTLGQLLRDHIGKINSVVSTRTTIVLETLKEVSSLPVPRAKRKENRKKHGRT